MEPKKLCNFPRPGPGAVKRKGVAKECAAPRFRRRIGQNEIEAVLSWMTTGVVRKILNSANPRKIRV